MRKRMKHSLTAAALLLGAFFAGHRVNAGDAKGVESFFKEHCLRCHDAKKQSGDFRLDTLKAHFADAETAEHWSEVLLQINSGGMPPKKEPQPKADELGKVAEWISARLKEGEAARMALPPLVGGQPPGSGGGRCPAAAASSFLGTWSRGTGGGSRRMEQQVSKTCHSSLSG